MQQLPATCFATLLQNELNSDVVRFTNYVRTCLPTNRLQSQKKPSNLICWKTGSSVVGKTCNITFQLVLQQFCKTSCPFYVAHFTVPLPNVVPNSNPLGIKLLFQEFPFHLNVNATLYGKYNTQPRMLTREI